MTTETILFCRYAATEFRTYGILMYDLFADVCDEVLRGSIRATALVRPFVRYVVLGDTSKSELREICSLMNKYLVHRISKYEKYQSHKDDLIQLYLPKRFYEEIVLYFNEDKE